MYFERRRSTRELSWVASADISLDPSATYDGESKKPEIESEYAFVPIKILI